MGKIMRNAMEFGRFSHDFLEKPKWRWGQSLVETPSLLAYPWIFLCYHVELRSSLASQYAEYGPNSWVHLFLSDPRIPQSSWFIIIFSQSTPYFHLFFWLNHHILLVKPHHPRWRWAVPPPARRHWRSSASSSPQAPAPSRWTPS